MLWGILQVVKPARKRYGWLVLGSGAVGAVGSGVALPWSAWTRHRLDGDIVEGFALVTKLGFVAVGGVTALLSFPFVYAKELGRPGAGEPPLLRCETCGQRFPSRYYFPGDPPGSVCNGCVVRRPEAEPGSK